MTTTDGRTTDQPTDRPTNSYFSALAPEKKREKRAQLPLLHSSSQYNKRTTTLLPPGIDPNLLFHHHHHLSFSLKGRRKIFHFDVRVREERGEERQGGGLMLHTHFVVVVERYVIRMPACYCVEECFKLVCYAAKMIGQQFDDFPLSFPSSFGRKSSTHSTTNKQF